VKKYNKNLKDVYMTKVNSYVNLFALGHFSVDWVQTAIPALLPYFISVCHLNYKEAGFLIFANVLFSSITQPFFGYYADKVSKPWMVPLGPVICGVAMGIFAFTTNYTSLFFASMLSGLGSSIFHPEGALTVNRITGEKKGKALGLFSVGGNAGCAAGPFLAGIIAYKLDIHGLVLFTVINIILAALIFSKIPAAIELAKQQKKIAEQNSPAKPENDWGAFLKLAPIIFARSVGFTISNTFIPIYWIKVLGTSATTGSFVLTGLFTAGVVLTYVGGVLADRIGNIKVMRLAFLIAVPGAMILTNTTNLPIAVLMLLPLAVGIFVPYSPVVILGQTYLGKNVGLASGITMGLASTLGGVMSPVVGWGADKWGVPTALQILWIAALIGVIFSFVIPNPDKRPSHISAVKEKR